MAALETAAGTISAHVLRLREQTAFGELIQSRITLKISVWLGVFML